MDKRNMRIGDFDEIAYSEIFEGIALTRRFFDKNGFAVDTSTGNEVLYKQDGGIFVTAEDNGDGCWYVQIRHGRMTFAGDIFTVHHFQHLLVDCLVFWKILI